MKKQKRELREYVLILNGKLATDAEYKRIIHGRAHRSDPNERATKPIEQVDRGFNLMR